MSGVTAEGFDRKTLEQIKDDLEDGLRTELSPTIDTSSESPLGQLNGVFAAELASAWEALEDAYHAFDPDAGEGVTLDNAASLTGTTRRGESASEAVLTLSLNAGAAVPAGALVAVDGRPDIVFETSAAVENTGGSPTTKTVRATCTTNGPIAANAGTLTVIVTPYSGWTAVTNEDDAELGRNVDSDQQLRERREAELALRGSTTTRAIVADVIDAFDDVDTARCFENATRAYDALTGLGPNSIELLIDDGAVATVDNDELAQVVFDAKAAGSTTQGAEYGIARDENDDEHQVFFSRVSRKDVYVSVVLTTTDDYAGSGDHEEVKAAIAAAGNAMGISTDIIALVLQAAPLTVAGVVDVPSIAIGFGPAPTSDANLTIELRERGLFSTANIEVTVA